MLLPIKPICSASKIRRDGTSLIFIQYCMSADNKTLLNTEITIPPRFWNRKMNRVSDNLPIELGKAVELNKELRRQIRLAEDIISFAIERKMKDPVKFAKATFKPDFDINKLEKAVRDKPEGKFKLNRDFFFQFDDYIKSKENSVAQSTQQVFKILKAIMQS